MDGTWRTNPRPNPLRAALGILAFVLLLAAGYFVPHQYTGPSTTSTPTPTPTASPTAHR